MSTVIEKIRQVAGNRGARRAAHHLVKSGVAVREVEIADPKPGRAEALGDLYRAHGSMVTAHELRGEELLADADPAVPTIVAVDDLDTVAALLADDRMGDLLVQGVVQGEGAWGESGFVLGVHAAALRGREDALAQARALFTAVSRTVARGSSAAFRTQPDSAYALHRERDAVGRESARQVTTLERQRVEDVLLQLSFEDERYPLVVVTSDAGTLRQREDHAREVVGDRGAVALVLGGDHVHVSIVDRRRAGRGLVLLSTEFRAPPPPPPRQANVEAAPPVRVEAETPRVASARFTD